MELSHKDANAPLGTVAGTEIPVEPETGEKRVPFWLRPTRSESLDFADSEDRIEEGDTIDPGAIQDQAVPLETSFEKLEGTTVPAGRFKDPTGTVPENPGLAET